MPTVTSDGVTIRYAAAGDGETVAFVGDAGYGPWQWGWQHAALAGPRETLVCDLRGTGGSDAPPGPYSVADLAGDLRAVLADHGTDRVHLVGTGLGGMVALRFALDSQRPVSLALFGTAAYGAELDLDPLFAPPDDAEGLRRTLRAAVTPSFADSHAEEVDRIVEWRRVEDADRSVWRAQTAAVDGFDVRDRLYEVTVPTLVVHGVEDAVWPIERGASLADDLPRGEFLPVADAGHLAHVEASGAVNDELVAFLDARE